MNIRPIAVISKLIIASTIYNPTYAQNLIFEKQFGSNSFSQAQKVIETLDGGLLLIGNTDENSSGLADFHLIKTDAQGNEVWSLTHGGFNNDIPLDGVQLADSSFVIIGFTGSFTTSPSRDLYLIKVDSKGSLIWTKSIGGHQTDEGTGIKANSDGSFILCGFTESFGAGGRDAWLVKTDSMGDTLWTRTYGGVDLDNASDIELTADGGFLMAGNTESFAGGTGSDLWMIKTDSLGNEDWHKSFGGANTVDWGWDCLVTSSGYMAVGLKDNNPSAPAPTSGDGHFIKTDLQGNLIWDKTVTHSFRLEINSIAMSDNGGFVLAGAKVYSPSSTVFWVAKSDSTGSIIWSKDLGVSNSFNRAFSIAHTSNGDIVATGLSGQTPNLDPKIHLVRLTDSTYQVGIGENHIPKNSVVIFPNPSNGKVNVDFKNLSLNIKKAEVISIATGQLLQSFDTNGRDNVEFEILQSGLYLIRFRDENDSLIDSKKLIVN